MAVPAPAVLRILALFAAHTSAVLADEEAALSVDRYLFSVNAVEFLNRFSNSDYGLSSTFGIFERLSVINICAIAFETPIRILAV